MISLTLFSLQGYLYWFSQFEKLHKENPVFITGSLVSLTVSLAKKLEYYKTNSQNMKIKCDNVDLSESENFFFAYFSTQL